ncbi:hypothetical protein PC9H_010631 [Pleurotus ostreatus]|uniref:BTB domain-containing protein n=2 Tax=Pleurotus TaxID=5320 RepID=A0A8H7DPW9_PLEOS|nr:uncharacterized protein PC9H_010631 [Pleurotus ostreatus]KAF7422475.1 hypothetical protein PC9H_010631 [Pleurotus ostreatus]KAG9227646.1 hypothetical protein CCMSSC00406_0000708 [Pleurotus cornucopiae]KAJ8691667.1 hypothetical protein PTI98_011217 [Pleurotus ostreatus]
MEESLVPIYIRDLEYYIDDGNVILLVEATLFKVHRSMLMKDESVFCGMFSLPSENNFESSGASTIPVERSSMDGQSDESPIRLPEITASQFRALLWSLYALPADLVATAETQPQEHRFIDLATISHKYQFITMEKWALNTLVALYIHQGCAYDMLDRLTAVAVMCDYKPLLDIVLGQWRRSIGEGFGLLNAAEVFQRHGLHDLLGLTYLALLRKKRHEWPADNKHVIRLLNGYYNLVQECSSLPNTPPHFEHATTCTSAPRCGENWRKTWKRVIIEIHTGKLGKAAQVYRFDLPGQFSLALSVFQAIVDDSIPEHGGLDKMVKECRLNALDATRTKAKDVQGNLITYFSDL